MGWGIIQYKSMHLISKDINSAQYGSISISELDKAEICHIFKNSSGYQLLDIMSQKSLVGDLHGQND